VDPPAYNSTSSAAAIVLGTIVVGGLVYLLLRGADGAFYRYPYRAPGAYPHPAYRPYVGPYTRAPAYTYGPYRRCLDGTFGQWCR
jgi:hypothetical protein